MKRLVLFFAAGVIALSAIAQIDKTQLSLEASKTNDQNVKLLSGYTWKRTVEGFVENEQVFLKAGAGSRKYKKCGRTCFKVYFYVHRPVG